MEVYIVVPVNKEAMKDVTKDAKIIAKAIEIYRKGRYEEKRTVSSQKNSNWVTLWLWEVTRSL